jgi:hypothetical protein
MQLAVTFTVNDRPKYFEQVLESWSAVRGKEDVAFFFSCEPSDWALNNGRSAQLAADWLKQNKVLASRVSHNSRQFGAGHNPYVALQRGFGGWLDYVILAEDDLLVSDDILEYHKWAATEYVDDDEIATVHSWRQYPPEGASFSAVERLSPFADSLVWGTWRDRWPLLEANWDHDYNTGVGNYRGWDWHFRLRLLPAHGKVSLYPQISRVQNIGEEGTHTPKGADIPIAEDFSLHREPTEFKELVVQE